MKRRASRLAFCLNRTQNLLLRVASFATSVTSGLSCPTKRPRERAGIRSVLFQARTADVRNPRRGFGVASARV